MAKKKIISFVLIIAMVLTVWAPAFEGSAVAAPGLGVSHTVLDISKGSITIGANGASGGGLAEAETALNPDGYKIIGTSTVDTNNIIVEQDVNTIIHLENVTMTTKDKACLYIGQGANVDVILDSVNMTANATRAATAKPAIELSKATTASLTIRGGNTLVATLSAGIGLYNDVSLTINGGNRDVLNTTGGGQGAGIGSVSSTRISGTTITINGGNINALGGGATQGCPGIGGYSSNSTGNIIINGGNINASSAKGTSVVGIGFGGSANREPNPPVVVNGGSITGGVQGTPQNKNGEALRLVEATAAGMADKVFTFLDVDNIAREAVADDSGKLYVYVPVDATEVSASCDGEDYIGEIVAGEPATATLEKYAGNSCTCTADTAAVDFPDKNVLVYDVRGSEQLTLTAEFKPAEDCEYPIHNIASVSYSLVGDVPETMATVNDNVLTVYSAVAGQTLQVQAVVKVNNVTYTKVANIMVSSDDAYVFDLSKGSVEIYNDNVIQNDVEYPLTDTDVPIKIVQSGKGTTANTITVGSAVSKTIIIENLNMAREKVIMGTALFTANVGAVVDLVLEGENSIVDDAGNAFPAIRLINQSVMTISGDGSLNVVGGAGTPGIGQDVSGEPGDLIINGGRMTARGGSEAAGLGAGRVGNASRSNITINGGRVIAAGGDGSPRDLKANVTINGGSVATLDASGAVSSAVRFDAEDVTGSGSSLIPKNAAGQNVYLVELTFVDEQADKSVVYKVNKNGTEGSEQQAYTDVAGKLYLYLPVEADYQQVVATPAGSDDEYFKRIKVSDNKENTGVLSNNPVAKIISFNISGQIGTTVIDHDAKTIKVTMPDGAAIDNVLPSVNAGGAEYTPQGLVDFSAANPITYKLVSDDGSEVQYSVSVEQRQFAPGEKTVLNIADGDIIMWEDGDITVGGLNIAPNSNGYIITGSSSEHFLVIDNITTPIVFRDLTINAPVASDEMDVEAAVTVLTSADITLEGVNTITGAAGNNAVYASGNFIVDGEGILKLTGGAGSAAVNGEEGGAFVINGGSVFIHDNSNFNTMKPVSSVTNGITLYPLEITIADANVAGELVKYSDTPTASGVPAMKDRNYLVDADGVISVYRPESDYDITISRGDNDEYKYYGKTLDSIPAEITVGLPQIEELTFTPPTTSLALNLPITFSGKYLGGDMIVTATGQNGEKVSATAVYNARNDKWVATLALPANQTGRDYTYTLAATADGRPQTLNGVTTITMLEQLKLISFKLDKYQLGEEVIGEDETGKLYVLIDVPYDVDMENTRFAPILDYTGVRHIPTGSRNFSSPVPYTIYNYQSYEQKRDSRVYTVTVTPEVAPTVDSIAFTDPGYSGGNVDVTLNGENFDKLLNAATENGGRIAVSVAGKEWYLTKDDVRKGINKVTVTLPSNVGGTQNKRYPITVSVNGVEQELEGDSVINVPGELEMNASIESFSFEDLPECAPELNLNQAVIDDREEGQSGTINIKVPWKTDLTSLVPTVSTTNSDATYVPRGAVDFTNPVTFTVTAVKGNTKDYIVTVTRVASAAEKDPSIKSITVEEQRDSVIEETPGENGLIPITITMPTGTDLKSVEPIIQLAHPDATYEPHGALDFSEGPQEFTVTSADGTVQKYEVTVRNAKKKKKQNDQVVTSEQEVDFKAYITGYDDKTFRPNNSITRAEAAAMLARLDEDFKDGTRYSHMFEDVTNDFWATDYIGYLFKGGVVKGTNGNFEASREITRMEFVAMLCRYMEMDEVATQDIKFNDIDNVWGRDEILLAASNGVTSGYSDGTFRPNAVITRAEAVSMLNRLLDRSPLGEVKAAMDKQESPFSDLTAKHWAYAEIMSAVKNYGVKTVSKTTAGETTTEVVVNFK